MVVDIVKGLVIGIVEVFLSIMYMLIWCLFFQPHTTLNIICSCHIVVISEMNCVAVMIVARIDFMFVIKTAVVKYFIVVIKFWLML